MVEKELNKKVFVDTSSFYIRKIIKKSKALKI